MIPQNSRDKGSKASLSDREKMLINKMLINKGGQSVRARRRSVTPSSLVPISRAMRDSN